MGQKTTNVRSKLIRMQSFLDVQQKLIPDLLGVMERRYHILRYINAMAPVGRRSLATSLQSTERTLRSEVEFLKKQNLIAMSRLGMTLTDEGMTIMESLHDLMHKFSGLDKLEQKIQERLQIDKVIIVPGDSEQSTWIKHELGKVCAHCMKEEWHRHRIIAVTGGSTMAEVANALQTDDASNQILFVPARGGIGEMSRNQANTIVEKMARKTKGHYKTLYVPDELSDNTYQSMIKEPMIQATLTAIQSADMIVHGIGEAIVMAEKRQSASSVIEKLISRGAVGEAFGSYFNEKGEIVHKVVTIGIQLEDISAEKRVIAVAGGKKKAKAIKSYMKRAHSSTILITDEAAAGELIYD